MASCRVCREDIKDGAKKCIHCDSYQGPRRFFSLSALVLSLIVALVSVVTAAVPVFRSLEPRHAMITYELLSCDAEAVHVVAINSGNVLGAVRGGQYEHSKSGKLRRYKLHVKGATPVVEPKKHVDFQLVRDTAGALPGGNTCAHYVSLELSSPGSPLKGGTQSAECPCVLSPAMSEPP